MERSAFGILLLALLGLAAPTAQAGPLTPYRAHYQAEFDLGLSFDGEAVRELKQHPDGSWELSIEASTLLASIDERSRFNATDHGLQPLQYRYQRKLLGKRRQATLTFDWAQGQVINDVQDKPWAMAVPAGTLDKVSYQLQLRRDLAAGRRELEYRVADGGHIKDYRFESLGEEAVQTPAGRYRALKVRRVRDAGSRRDTLIWFAPELDYAIVKLRQTEGKGRHYQLLLEGIE